MRSYHKVYSTPARDQIQLHWFEGAEERPLYVQIVLRSRAIDFVNGYNYLASCAFAQGGGFNPPHWATFNSDGSLNSTFSGQQLAGQIFPLRAYQGHPLN